MLFRTRVRSRFEKKVRAPDLFKRTLAIMQVKSVVLLDEAQCEVLESFLVERIYEFNSHATGYFDGRLVGGSIHDSKGEVIAGYCGHTWGGSCELTSVWVRENHRGQGLGRALLESAEAEAGRRGCRQLVLRTHSFQAPGFYEAQGYERRHVVEDVPKGYSDFVYVKVLRANPGG